MSFSFEIIEKVPTHLFSKWVVIIDIENHMHINMLYVSWVLHVRTNDKKRVIASITRKDIPTKKAISSRENSREIIKATAVTNMKYLKPLSRIRKESLWSTTPYNCHLFAFTNNFSRVLFHFFVQEEEKLNLSNKHITDKGVQQLANATQKNMVNQNLSVSISFTLTLSHLETQTTWSLKKRHRGSRYSIFGWGYSAKQGETYSLFILLVHIFTVPHRHWKE